MVTPGLSLLLWDWDGPSLNPLASASLCSISAWHPLGPKQSKPLSH